MILVDGPRELLEVSSTGKGSAVAGKQWAAMDDEDGEERAVGEEGGYTNICYTQTVAYVQLLREGGRGRRKG